MLSIFGSVVSLVKPAVQTYMPYMYIYMFMYNIYTHIPPHQYLACSSPQIHTPTLNPLPLHHYLSHPADLPTSPILPLPKAVNQTLRLGLKHAFPPVPGCGMRAMQGWSHRWNLAGRRHFGKEVSCRRLLGRGGVCCEVSRGRGVRGEREGEGEMGERREWVCVGVAVVVGVRDTYIHTSNIPPQECIHPSLPTNLTPLASRGLARLHRLGNRLTYKRAGVSLSISHR